MGTGGSVPMKMISLSKPCSARLLVGVPQVAAWVMARGPDTSPDIVGWEKGEGGREGGWVVEVDRDRQR